MLFKRKVTTVMADKLRFAGSLYSPCCHLGVAESRVRGSSLLTTCHTYADQLDAFDVPHLLSLCADPPTFEQHLRGSLRHRSAELEA